jgi:tripartite-type tricarboxylate transporter receptor subunit TctC
LSALPPGGAADINARLIGQWLSERLGKQVLIENRPGAGMNIAAEAVIRAPADGYTILLVASPHAINATLYDKLSFDFIRDIAPVASLTREAIVLVVNPSVPVETVPEFIAYATSNPGKLNYGSAGSGTVQHIAAELFKMMTGVDMVHVPYRGGTLRTDLVSGQIDLMFDVTTTSLEFIRTGKVRALAVTTTPRSELLSDLPTVGDFVPGFEATNFRGVGAPGNTPVEIIDKLNREINGALSDPKMKARLGNLGGAVLAGSPADFGKLIADETEKWGKVIRTANIKPE